MSSSGVSSDTSVLTFNLSVSDKSVIHDTPNAFQIMPSTRNYLSDKIIESFIAHTDENPSKSDILIHVNYITRVFKDGSIDSDSFARDSLRQYVKLAKRVGTKNILVHGPASESEWRNIALGMKVIYDEIISAGCNIQIEMPAWTKDFPRDTITMYDYYNIILGYCEQFPKGSYYLVPDTAHLHANGFKTSIEFISFITHYSKYIEWIHLNGNMNVIGKTDKHCPIFSNASKLAEWDELSRELSKMGLKCVAEVTHEPATYAEWSKYANTYGFTLVSDNDGYSM